ncbi:hypothetical protein C3F09_05150 [candidate division GN15 bacterium]|uniref:Uncharacterized protein n=1 Tax=candidate division GN15 bacterium TaxID=2072418 RepID=A0A855X201_9BACT|nr:MAG: hypothetical protein C3F09_05150 [candidate division GN15 bacterium]
MVKSICFRGAFVALAISLAVGQAALSQDRKPPSEKQNRHGKATASFYDVPPRYLIDIPTAGTLPRGYFGIGFRFYSYGGAIAYTDIGISNRFLLGVSFGADSTIGAVEPRWNPDMEFNVKFRLVDELEYFPAVSIGFNSQGDGHYSREYKRYAYKSKGFYAVASRSFYFYKWTSGWHGGINYSTENDRDKNGNISLFVGFDATFNYDLAYLMEYDFALNDNKGAVAYSGRGRGYLNASLKWLFTDNLEMELILKDLLVNRRESKMFSREVRFQYIDHF